MSYVSSLLDEESVEISDSEEDVKALLSYISSYSSLCKSPLKEFDISSDKHKVLNDALSDKQEEIRVCEKVVLVVSINHKCLGSVDASISSVIILQDGSIKGLHALINNPSVVARSSVSNVEVIVSNKIEIVTNANVVEKSTNVCVSTKQEDGAPNIELMSKDILQKSTCLDGNFEEDESDDDLLIHSPCKKKKKMNLDDIAPSCYSEQDDVVVDDN
ncbi:unnamed protein product [Citrullus colocynthis]|uniref:Uncharacterized protein n=1 Tax=Citrullus colocynthis TaxID=252529 RepID=A0ABP0YUY4_9ROSI